MVMVHICGNINSQFSKLAHNKRHNLQNFKQFAKLPKTGNYDVTYDQNIFSKL